MDSIQNYHSESVKGNTIELKSIKDNGPKISSEESGNDSELDILKLECGKKCDDLETFSDHFKQSHNL